MSLTKQVDVVCPNCGSPQKFKLWQSLNVGIDPAEKERLLSGEICTLRCESCGEESPVEHDLLYHDPKRKLMIKLQYGNGEEDSALGPTLENLSAVIAESYRFRVVRTFKGLVEKVMIFDDRLDDRIIEVLKLQSWRKLMDLLPDSEPMSTEIYYQELMGASDGEKDVILAVVAEDDIYPVSIPYKTGYLTSLGLALNALTARSDEKTRWLVVDRAYAARIVEQTRGAAPANRRSGTTQSMPEGAVRWKDEHGQINQAQVPPSWLQNALGSGKCKLLYRVLIKDPVFYQVQEDSWELTDDQVEKFVDGEQTAYCAVAYVRGEQKLLLVAKSAWDALPAWHGSSAVTESGAAAQFVCGILVAARNEWPSLNEGLNRLCKGRFILADEATAAYDLALAIVSAELITARHIFTPGRFKRLRHWSLKMIEASGADYGTEEIDEYMNYFDKALKDGEDPFFAIPARLLQVWVGPNIKEFDVHLGGESSGFIDPIIIKAVTRLFVPFLGYWESTRELCEIVDGPLPSDLDLGSLWT
jgi:hypothetical protein